MQAKHTVVATYPAHCDIDVTCAGCRHVFHIRLTRIEYQAYFIDGELAQKALARLPIDVRELCISRTCGECWADLFGKEDDHGGE